MDINKKLDEIVNDPEYLEYDEGYKFAEEQIRDFIKGIKELIKDKSSNYREGVEDSITDNAYFDYAD